MLSIQAAALCSEGPAFPAVAIGCHVPLNHAVLQARIGQRFLGDASSKQTTRRKPDDARGERGRLPRGGATAYDRAVHDATKAERRAARERVSAYHEAELTKLVEHVEEAIARYRAGEIDVYDVDEVIHRYSKTARELWKFCWSGGSGSHVLFAARTLDFWSAEGDEVDWWEEAERRRHRR